MGPDWTLAWRTRDTQDMPWQTYALSQCFELFDASVHSLNMATSYISLVLKYFTVDVACAMCMRACIVFYKELMYILVSCSFDDVTSGIGIGITIAVADSIGYRAPTWYRSNPNANWDQSTAFDAITLQQDIIYNKQGNRRLHFAPAVHSRHPFLPIGNAAYLQHAGRGPSHGHGQHTQKIW